LRSPGDQAIDPGADHAAATIRHAADAAAPEKEAAHMDAGLLADLAIKALVVGFSLVPLARPGASHFAGKAMGIRALVYPVTTLLIPGVWLLSGRPTPYPVLADIALALPFAIDAGANVFGLFAIPGFDALPHSVGWFFLSVAFGLAVAPLVGQRLTTFGLVLGFGAVIDIIWEVAEFALMKSGSSGLQLTYENTIQDLVMSLLGATVGAVAVATILWPAIGTPATVFGWAP